MIKIAIERLVGIATITVVNEFDAPHIPVAKVDRPFLALQELLSFVYSVNVMVETTRMELLYSSHIF